MRKFLGKFLEWWEAATTLIFTPLALLTVAIGNLKDILDNPTPSYGQFMLEALIVFVTVCAIRRAIVAYDEI